MQASSREESGSGQVCNKGKQSETTASNTDRVQEVSFMGQHFWWEREEAGLTVTDLDGRHRPHQHHDPPSTKSIWSFPWVHSSSRYQEGLYSAVLQRGGNMER